MLLVSEKFRLGNNFYERSSDGSWCEIVDNYEIEKVEDEDAIEDLEELYQQQWSRDKK